MAKDAAPEYGADQITVLEGLEPVRKRPGMYIGSTTSRGLHHLIWEIVDNAVDEALAGHCSEISVDIDPSHEIIIVNDNGRGVPVGTNAKTGESALDLVFTKLHAGGKFGDGGYKVSGGLHGVGASVTNALSEYLHVLVKRDGHEWTAKYARGKSTQPVTQGKKITKKDGTGTRVEWKFDTEIFDADAKYSLSTIEQRLREKSYLVRGLTFRFTSTEKGEQVFVSKNGIADYIKELNSEREAVHPGVIFFSSDDLPQYLGEEGIPVEVALQWTQGSDERVYSFANVVPTPEGGAHVTGLRRAITRALNNYAYEAGKLKKDKSESLEGKDIFEGLAAAVTVKVEEPQFEGQTKQKLNNAEANSATFSFLYAAFTDWLTNKDNAKQAKAILDRCLLAREIRLAKGKISKKLRNEATSIFTDSNLPGKLADCLDTVEPNEREIFIVEGDSAAGCFTGDTRVALADGRSKTFLELAADWEAGITHEGFALDTDGDMHIVPLIHPRLTKAAAEIVIVEMDDRTALRCTPDHLFRLDDGDYVRADRLTSGHVLAAFDHTVAGGLATLVRPRTITSVASIATREDVYDLTVDEHHNFALATGIFVHNSAKGARDANFQAILPIRGKILNVMGAKNGKAFDNAEIEGILTALGGRKDVIGKNVVATLDPDQRRYGKIVLLSVDADEMTMVRWRATGEIRSVRIGPFIDQHIESGNGKGWDVACFDLESNEVRWRPIAQMIAHAIDEPLYEIRTAYGRSVRVTASHSVFVLRDGTVELAKGSEIAEGDLVVAPERLPLANPDPVTKIDLARALHGTAFATKIYAHAPAPAGSDGALAVIPRTGIALADLDAAALDALADEVMLTLGEDHEELRCGRYVTVDANFMSALGTACGSRDPYSMTISFLEDAPEELTAAMMVDWVLDMTGLLRIPDLVWNVAPELQRQFLHDYAEVAGDVREDGSLFIHAPLPHVADQLRYLLLMHGITADLRDATSVVLAPADAERISSGIHTGPEPCAVATPAGGDLIGLPVTSVEQVNPTSNLVYDFSVDGDENFICGSGGICCHNTDADVDGAHIANLLLTMFMELFPQVIQEGRVFLARPPLFKINLDARGDNFLYAYDDKELSELLKQHKRTGTDVSRFKGLGEMNPENLEETVFDPKTRQLLQVRIEDPAEATEVLNLIMGSKAEPRRQWLEDIGLRVDEV